MTKKKIVLFDIDHTLFDATLYRQRMFEIIEKFLKKDDAKDFREILERQYVSHRKKIGYFDAKFMLSQVMEELGIEEDIQEIFDAIIEDEASYKEALFEETIEVLETLAKDSSLTLGIFSSGRPEHQMKKIELFQHVFHRDHIHVTTMKEKELPHVLDRYQNTDEELYLIDDILQLLQHAKMLKENVTTIWMKRGHYAKAQEEATLYRPDFSITNLREVISILTK